MSQQPLGLVLSFYFGFALETLENHGPASTAAWACIEFLQIAECNEDRNRWSKVSTAAWACIEFLRLAMPVAAHGLTASQQPLGLVLSFYPIKM